MLILDDPRHFLSIPENEFLRNDMAKAAKSFRVSLADLRSFTGINFSVYPDWEYAEGFQYALAPELNVDRAGSGSAEEVTRYYQLSDELGGLIDAVGREFEAFIRTAKKSLGSDFLTDR